MEGYELGGPSSRISQPNVHLYRCDVCGHVTELLSRCSPPLAVECAGRGGTCRNHVPRETH